MSKDNRFQQKAMYNKSSRFFIRQLCFSVQSVEHFPCCRIAIVKQNLGEWGRSLSAKAQNSGMARTVLIGCIDKTPNVCCYFYDVRHVTACSCSVRCCILFVNETTMVVSNDIALFKRLQCHHATTHV